MKTNESEENYEIITFFKQYEWKDIHNFPKNLIIAL